MFRRFFFEIADPNPAYEQLSELLESIQKPHTNVSFDKPMPLTDLMHRVMENYYVYNGSLTTVRLKIC